MKERRGVKSEEGEKKLVFVNDKIKVLKKKNLGKKGKYFARPHPTKAC